MSRLKHRLARLEERIGVKEDGLVVTLMQVGAEFALDQETCRRILAETGVLKPGATAILDFLTVPQGLSARELKSYLREHAEEICGSGGR